MGSRLRCWLLLTVLLYGAVAENIVQRHRQLQQQMVKVSTAAGNRILFVTSNAALSDNLKASDDLATPTIGGKLVQALTQNVAFGQFNYMFIAIALQELMAYTCNGELIAADVLTLVNQASASAGGDADQYMLAGYRFTGEPCTEDVNGGSGVLVFAHKDLKLPATIGSVTTDLVSHSKKAEKATTIVRVPYSGYTFCFAGSHFPTKSTSVRVESFVDAVKTGNLFSCDLTLWGGDFNLRTGPNNEVSAINWENLATGRANTYARDEFAGGTPWDPAFKDCREQNDCAGWSEATITFLPTYSIIKSTDPTSTNVVCLPLDDEKNTHANGLCYRADRPMSWTDRVLYQVRPATLAIVPGQYDSVLGKTILDHAPVRFECSVSGKDLLLS